MIKFPSQIENAVRAFSSLPGVGSKTALRQVMSMSAWSEENLMNFASAVREIAALNYCTECGYFSEAEICDICLSAKRSNNKSLCIVESLTDMMAIEKSENFQGVYHILGGVLNPLAGLGPKQLRIEKLQERINKLEIESIILAINPSVEGDATCAYIKQLLPETIEIQRIGFGMPIGGSLEYLDSQTISKALEYRRSF
jgi:recombination protein RecR